MQKPKENTVSWVRTNEEDILEKMVKKDHVFRTLNELLDFDSLVLPLKDLYSNTGAQGIDIKKGFKSLLIQFWEDYSDREMEKVLQENVAVKWFCGFDLLEETPDFTYFCKLRKRIGTKSIADIFNTINGLLREKGFFGDVFKFVDASSIVTKTALWEERDKAIAQGEEKLNNTNVEKYAADKDARWGAKGKKNIWFGHKRHHLLDMRFGMIEKVVVTAANVLDFQVGKSILPKKGACIFADKLYDTKGFTNVLRAKECHSAVIEKNTKKGRNNALNAWRSKRRMPFEGGFSKLRKRAKFRGHAKVTMQCFFEAICQNLKKAIALSPA
jgi:transposase, IS5 family